MGPAGHSLAALAAAVGAPVGLAALAVRPAWRVGLPERLGRAPEGVPGALWIHGASVGEALAAVRLADRLGEMSTQVVLSTGTSTARALVHAERPDLPCALAPLDHPWCVALALRRVRPRSLVLVETELWPFWIRAAHAHGIPIAVVSGRLSDRSFPRYQRVGALLRGTLRRLSAVGARSALDAERFRALGARAEAVSVTGDLKLEPPACAPALAGDLDALLGQTPLLAAGSTHPGEEETALAALAALERGGRHAALVLAPRHPERAAEALLAARRAGRAARLRSAGGSPLRPGEVLVLDSLGELPGVYTRASVAFVGGTLVPVGGHNLLEPVFAGRTVLFGPHTENQRDAAELLLASGAGRRVADAAALARAAAAALADPASGREPVRTALARLDAHRGTLERSAALVRETLARGPA